MAQLNGEIVSLLEKTVDTLSIHFLGFVESKERYTQDIIRYSMCMLPLACLMNGHLYLTCVL